MTLCVESIKKIQAAMRQGEEEWSGHLRRGDGYYIGGHITPLGGIPSGPYSQVVVKGYLAQTTTEARNWRERLFTLPWRPWRKFKTVPGKPVYYRDSSGTIYTCKRGADELRREAVTQWERDVGIVP